MRRATILFLASAFCSHAQAQDPIARGRALTQENCARCHAVGPEGGSPLAAAPPFRAIGRDYPIADLEEALAERILTAHPGMPEFAFEPDDVAAIIAYLESVQDN